MFSALASQFGISGAAAGYIQIYFMSFLGPWTGESIICVGDYIEAEDHPPGLFTEGE